MMKRIDSRNFTNILKFLYEREQEFAEEISCIEFLYIRPRISVFCDNPANIKSFLIITEYDENRAGAFLHSPTGCGFLKESITVLSRYNAVHIQTGKKAGESLKRELQPVHAYSYSMMSLNRECFQPVPEPVPIRITPEIIYSEGKNIDPEPDILAESARRGVLFGFKRGRKWISISGGIRGSANYYILSSETDPEFRGRGYATAGLSHSIAEILRRGGWPFYGLDSLNIPSMKIAQNLGFKQFAEKTCLLTGDWELKRTALDDPAIPDSSFYQ